jgi:hypothetical protein
MSDAKEYKLEAVSERTTRARELILRWGWVEPTVWTERMLTALEQGVKGGRWFSLIDHQRWKNAFFADQGLYSLKRAHELALSQSRLCWGVARGQFPSGRVQSWA